MIFSLLWARLYEVGNFKIPIKSRYMYYGAALGLPTVLHAGYIAITIRNYLSDMDTKYTPLYYTELAKR